MKTIHRRKKPYQGDMCPYCHVELEYKYYWEDGVITRKCPNCRYVVN